MSRTIEEIRSALKNKHGFVGEQLKLGKKELRMKLEELEAESFVEDTVAMEDTEECEDASVDVLEMSPIQPPMDSEDWADYVMSQFKSDELEQGNPTCDGLRRITEALIGPIMGRDILVHQAPNKENYGTATVVCSVRVLNNIPDHLLYSIEMKEEDAADVNRFNTQEPYHLHPTATAATRAEARALRKILRLKKVVAAEELAGDVSEDYADIWKPNDPVQEEQVNLLDLVCQRCDINVMEYINSGENIYNTIYELDKNKAQSMIQHINKIQQQKVSRPIGVGAYDANWR